MATSTKVNGKIVKIGDRVGFKADVEQAGEIVEIIEETNGVWLVLTNPEGFYGEYIGGETRTTERAADCWT